MKKLVSVLLLCLMSLSFPIQGFAQSKDDQLKQFWDDMKAKRAAFFTQKIGLTPAEAQAFWPVYDEYQSKKGELHNQMMAQFKSYGTKKPDGKFEYDYAKANENFIIQKFQEARLEKIYFEKFKTILCPEKVFRYYQAERDWANKLLKDIENRGSR
jgi:hypothetical protein